MKNSEHTLSPHLSLSGPDVPPPQPFPEVTANGSQSSLRKKSRPTIQLFKDKLHGYRAGGELDGSEKRGTQLNGSGSKGSDILNGEHRTSRFAEWRRKNFGKRRSSEQVSQASSHHKTESPKSHRGKNREHIWGSFRRPPWGVNLDSLSGEHFLASVFSFAFHFILKRFTIRQHF